MEKNILVIPDCWNELLYSGDYPREFVSISIIDNNLTIGLIKGLHVSSKLKPFFKKSGIYGDVGNCRFLFFNVHYLIIEMNLFLKVGENLKELSPVKYRYNGDSGESRIKFGFEGYLSSDSILQAFADFECDAERFELHIL
jgi:hypothetical protein